MAKLASFFDIILSMEKEDCERHKSAHVHAWYQGHAASFDARTGRMLAKGKNGFPRRQAGWIKTWIEIHADDLSAAWEMLRRELRRLRLLRFRAKEVMIWSSCTM